MTFNPINPIDPIPNSPFYWPIESGLQTPQGPLIFGAGIDVDYATGVININPTPPSSLGTVTKVIAGVGIVTVPPTGIVSSGSVQLAPVVGLTPGTYTYPALTVDIYGRITSAVNGVTPLQAVSANYPISVSGLAPAVTVSIASGSTTNAGAVQLADNTSTPSDTLALTAKQGYLLQNQVSALAATSGIQFLAGTLNATTGNVVTATPLGVAAGITSGSALPAAASTNVGAVLLVATAGTYTPPGGTSCSAVAGDQFLSDGTQWVWFQTGFRANYATTTSPGIVRLATTTEVQALADNTIAVTPFGLSGMIASTTQKGFVELATDSETLLLADSTRAVTPSNLAALQASTTQRGLVQLNDTLTSTSVTQAPTARALKEAYDATIHTNIIQANGDLIVGQAANNPQILSKGSDGQVLTVDVAAPLGITWKTPTLPQATPIGAMCWFTSNDSAKVPVGWLVADGSSYAVDSTNEYYALYLLIGDTFTPAGDPVNTFRIPDLRGQFIRGWNDAGGNPGTLDPGRAFGSCQTSAYQQHTHNLTDPGHFHAITDVCHNHTINDPGHLHSINDPGHSHSWNTDNATVVGNTAGLFVGDGKRGGSSGLSYPATTGITGTCNCTTGLTICCAPTGITQTQVSCTAITVNPSPVAAPTPNETRPVNLALLPLIKYKEP
jgi:microcystin-dependent protein